MASMMDIDIPSVLTRAEDYLHLEAGEQARELAASVLLAAATPSEVSRALFVLLQADYQEGRCALTVSQEVPVGDWAFCFDTSGGPPALQAAEP